jgi:hypothetical protein
MTPTLTSLKASIALFPQREIESENFLDFTSLEKHFENKNIDWEKMDRFEIYFLPKLLCDLPKLFMGCW